MSRLQRNGHLVNSLPLVAWTIVKTTLRKELQYEKGMRRGVGRNIVHAIVLS